MRNRPEEMHVCDESADSATDCTVTPALILLINYMIVSAFAFKYTGTFITVHVYMYDHICT